MFTVMAVMFILSGEKTYITVMHFYLLLIRYGS
jgi:hypothetical protein